MEETLVNGNVLKLSFWEKIVDQFWQLAITKGIEISVALLILFIGFFVIGKIGQLVNLAVNKRTEDPALALFTQRIVRIALKVMLLLSVASQMGIETTSFLAALGAAGLAIGLALQGSLSNFAGGVLILVFKPFRVADVIESGGQTGRVVRIDILHTVLNTADNKTVILPNAQVANGAIINFTTQATRRVDLSVGISYNDNIAHARATILDLVKKDNRVLSDPAPVVLVSNFGDNSVDLSIRVWTKTEDYWSTYWDLMEQIKYAYDEQGISIPFPQRDIHIINKESSGSDQQSR
jgi:small conductance mechanosensitive channel